MGITKINKQKKSLDFFKNFQRTLLIRNMSSRWYPLYNRGNPQLRIFLPNFWMKLVKNKDIKLPPNVVTFQVSSEMTRVDVKNYLERIYKVPVLNVKTINTIGRTFVSPYQKNEPGTEGELFKDKDIKLAIVTMPVSQEFEFPNVTEGEEEKVQKTSWYCRRQKTWFTDIFWSMILSNKKFIK